MIRRAGVIVVLALALLLVLSLPLCVVGVGCSEDLLSGVSRRVSLGGGVVRILQTTIKAPERETYRSWLTTGRWSGGWPIWPRTMRSPGELEVSLPVAFLGMCVGACLLVVVAVPLVWKARRRRRGLCLNCGYPGSKGAERCSECGVSVAEAAERSRVWPRNALRNASLVAFGFVLLLACASMTLTWMDRASEDAYRAQAFDYSHFLWMCEPRLKGTLVVAQAGDGPGGLADALNAVGSGGTIVLMPGRHRLGSRNTGQAAKLADVWILGMGREQTTLDLRLESADRVRIEGVTIECHDDECVYLRSGGTLAVRDCLVRGYNSGAGGSNAVYGSGTQMIFESCEFEGRTGRQEKRQSRGNAFDLRGDNRVYLRDCKFTNNSEIMRSAEAVFDDCLMTSDQTFYMPSGSSLYARNCRAGLPRRPTLSGARAFLQSLDDVEVLRHAAGGGGLRESDWTDPVAREMARGADTRRGGAFWTRLLLHPSAEVRAIAAANLAAASPKAVPMAAETALGMLGKSPLPRECVLALVGAGDTVKERLRAMAEENSQPAAQNAAGVLRVMEFGGTLEEHAEGRGGKK